MGEDRDGQGLLDHERARPAAGRSEHRALDRDAMPARHPARRSGPADIGLWFSVLRRMIGEERRFGHDFLWIPVAMGAGAAFTLSRPDDIALAATLVPFVAFCILSASARRISPAWVFPAMMATAFLAGMTAATIEIDRASTTLLDGEVVTHVTGVVTDRRIDEKGHWRYTIDLTSTADPTIRRPPDTVRLLARSRHEPIRLGEGITGLARISPPSGPVLPGGYDFAFNAFFQRIGAIGFFYGAPQAAPSISAAPETVMGSFRRFVAGTRETISARIRKVVSGQAGAFAAALTVADVGGLSDDTMTALRNAGLAHVISISGLHMVLVAGTFFVALRTLFGLSARIVHAFPVKKISAAGALVVSTAYLVISGASVPTERSWIMLAIMLVAVLLDRPALTLRNVALAAIAIIAVTPSSVVGPSFQMSFAATVALVSGYGALSRRRARRGRDPGAHFENPWWKSAALFVLGVTFTSVIAGAATGLFAAYHFHRLTSLGVLGNLLATPAISFIVMPMALLSVLLMPYGLDVVPLKIMGFGLDIVIAVAHRVSDLGGIVTTGRLPLAAATAMGSGFVILVLMRSRLRLAGVALVVIGFVMALPPNAPPDPDILISEDGRLVALVTGEGLATNRKRPPSFVFDQWLSAMDRTEKIAPVVEEGPPEEGESREKPDIDKRAPASQEQISRMRNLLATGSDGTFTCFGRTWCGALFKDISVITVSDAAYLGPACDLARIVVTSVPVRMTTCLSGARLFTSRSLRRSGSTEIYLEEAIQRSIAGPRLAEPVQAGPPGDSGRPDPTQERAPHLRVVSALSGKIRPWTIQRYYDWRTRSFDFGEKSQTAFSDSGG